VAFSLIKGVAEVITNYADIGATMKIIEGVAAKTVDRAAGETSSEQGKNVKGLPNALEQFASYTPLWTMSALTPSQFNDPRSYRNSPADLKHVVFSSAGRFDSQRVQTLYGSPEYYVDNFTMKTVISASQKTGNSNAITFEFEIYEPYSMGLFLQSLQLAALNANYPNYLQAPYVLRLDFLGSTDDGKLFTGIKPKFFTLKLSKVEFDTSESGSNYKVTAIPFNHQGYSNTVNRVFSDIAIFGDKNIEPNVKHLLVEGENSLCAVLNRNEEEAILDDKQLLPDTYIIEFPDRYDQMFNVASADNASNSATITPDSPPARTVGKSATPSGQFGENTIGKADMGFSAKDGGNFTFKRAGDVINSKTGVIERNQMVIDTKNRKFQFPTDSSITKIITDIILSSRYAEDALKTKPTDGFINWFKIDVQIQLDGFDDKRGDFAKKIIYRVIPYKVHVSIFSPPTAAPPGYSELEKLIAKRYDYIYSGQNNDVLKFDIKIQNLFYTGTNPKGESGAGNNANQDQNGVSENPPKKTTTNKGPSGGAAIAGNTGGRLLKKDPALMNVQPSPSGNETTEQMVAKAFHQAFLNNSGDMINVDLEILGDPYWMVDSGIGNYFAPPSNENKLTTADGTMNYEGSDVYIYLTFKTPKDIDENTGLYQFPNDGRESPFSGIYKVTFCENVFDDGVFRQRLKCIRMPLQPADFDGKRQPVDTNNALAVGVGEEEKPKTTTFDPQTEYGYGLL
jgi:hypothetical protein